MIAAYQSVLQNFYWNFTLNVHIEFRLIFRLKVSSFEVSSFELVVIRMQAHVLLLFVGAPSSESAHVLSVETVGEDESFKLSVIQCAGVEEDQAIIHRLAAQVGEQQTPNVRAGVGLKSVRR